MRFMIISSLPKLKVLIFMEGRCRRRTIIERLKTELTSTSFPSENKELRKNLGRIITVPKVHRASNMSSIFHGNCNKIVKED